MVEADIIEDLIKHHTVRVWCKHSWILVSQHKYLSNAETIANLIKQGETRECVKDAVAKLDSRCNKLLLKYFENWDWS